MKFMLLAITIWIQFIQQVYADEPLGRLFSTPAEREQLDRLREQQKNQSVETVVEAKVIESKPVKFPDAINMQGYVKRSDGKDGTVWINGEALQENSGNQDVQVGNFIKNSNAIPIRIPSNGKRLSLKAGQKYDPTNNSVYKSPSYSISKSSGTIGDESLP
ncbi:MAG TPA: hypothetical protein VLM20_05740 [Methylophilaceae bacterium]|nr:hypothetical protein [Methylophilaceae bacterium]